MLVTSQHPGRIGRIGIAAFTCGNVDDNKTCTPECGGKYDVDPVTGYEISGACRSGGFSIDARYSMSMRN
jgi:hypothetical protein